MEQHEGSTLARNSFSAPGHEFHDVLRIDLGSVKKNVLPRANLGRHGINRSLKIRRTDFLGTVAIAKTAGRPLKKYKSS